MVTRIRKLLEQKQLSPTQFADVIGVGRPVMSHILSERNKPSLEVVQRIIDAFPEISMSWLLRGTGEMLEGIATSPAETPSLPTPPVPGSAIEALPSPVVDTAEEPLVAPPTPLVLAEAPVAAPTVPTAGLSETARTMVIEQPVVPVPPTLLTDPVPALPVPAAFTPSLVDQSAPAAPKPFRTSRFVPASAASQPLPAAAPLASAMPEVPAVPASPLAATPAPFIPVSGPVVANPAPATTVAPVAAGGATPEAAMLPFLADSGKAIRRIVIFYRDGSFADYQPEQ
jgi:transcriptional regulator with XRE-family HTH domain